MFDSVVGILDSIAAADILHWRLVVVELELVDTEQIAATEVDIEHTVATEVDIEHTATTEEGIIPMLHIG